VIRIMDEFDARTTYLSSTKTPEEITSSYIKWNFETLHPGDMTSINFTAYVPGSVPCGSILVNKAKFLLDQPNGGDFVIENTSVVCQQECTNTADCSDGFILQRSGKMRCRPMHCRERGIVFCE